MPRTDLHTKYRPTDFDAVIGQDATVKSLQSVLEANSCHTFIFTGPSGVGKTTLARIVADWYDASLTEIDAATHSSVDAMRQLTESLNYSSLDGRNRAIIVDEAHALSQQAWQSLLKSIEEPPSGVVWLLCTTEARKIPDTIRTRCLVYDLRYLRSDDLFDLISHVTDDEGMDVSEHVLEAIAQSADGSPRRALTKLAQCVGCETRRDALLVMAEASAEEGDAVRQLCQMLAKGKHNWPKLMKLLKGMDGINPESIRLQITGYFSVVVLGAKSVDAADKALTILDAFAEPYPVGIRQLYPVLLSLGVICTG